MKSSFTVTIYKTGINLCVDVPGSITTKMQAMKGYIPVKGTINGHSFIQTLVPVKNAPYRLFVNGPMLKGSGARLGDTVKFILERDITTRAEPFPPALKKELKSNGLLVEFNMLIPAKQKEILRYLNHLKTEESLLRNIDKVIAQLKNKSADNKGFLRVLNSSEKNGKS
ncbi:MAG: DUF1905 domain-containing protein [Bacteroidota bacterium]